MYPVIVCIAKYEHDYIEEFVKYHLALGFSHIYLYDNEDEPIYHIILKDYLKYLTITHIKGNDFNLAIQFIILNHFTDNILHTSNKITHVIHIDIDEYIVLKKHKNICEFIEEYIKDDCQGIGINWRFFGSSGEEKQTNEPITQRFIRCQEGGDKHIKTLFKKEHMIQYALPHNIILSKGVIRSTNGKTIYDSFNEDYDYSIIQLNHYKTKTYEEFIKTSIRGRCDKTKKENEILETISNDYINKMFNMYDRNEVEDRTCQEFYASIKNDTNKDKEI